MFLASIPIIYAGKQERLFSPKFGILNNLALYCTANLKYRYAGHSIKKHAPYSMTTVLCMTIEGEEEWFPAYRTLLFIINEALL
jgi:hypothetical protein